MGPGEGERTGLESSAEEGDSPVASRNGPERNPKYDGTRAILSESGWTTIQG